LIRIVWRFRVRPGLEPEFESRYSSSGAWARLFAKGDGYLGSSLMRDTADPSRYVVIDLWRDGPSFEAFRKTNAAEYDSLDKDCEALTESEVHLGTFEDLR
jgi:heme-degrading monooxygenase HmoA